jgi:hypothetical protein
MEQLVARRAHNPKVVGSSPAPATQYPCNELNFSKLQGFFIFRRCNLRCNYDYSESYYLLYFIAKFFKKGNNSVVWRF